MYFSQLTHVIVDSTVQEKAVAHPTDSKLLETARSKVVEAAKAEGIELKQTYAKEGQLLGYKAALLFALTPNEIRQSAVAAHSPALATAPTTPAHCDGHAWVCGNRP